MLGLTILQGAQDRCEQHLIFDAIREVVCAHEAQGRAQLDGLATRWSLEIMIPHSVGQYSAALLCAKGAVGPFAFPASADELCQNYWRQLACIPPRLKAETSAAGLHLLCRASMHTGTFVCQASEGSPHASLTGNEPLAAGSGRACEEVAPVRPPPPARSRTLSQHRHNRAKLNDCHATSSACLEVLQLHQDEQDEGYRLPAALLQDARAGFTCHLTDVHANVGATGSAGSSHLGPSDKKGLKVRSCNMAALWPSRRCSRKFHASSFSFWCSSRDSARCTAVTTSRLII